MMADCDFKPSALANKSGPANCRPAFPLDAGRRFKRAVHAQPRGSAAVAHLWRWAAAPRAMKTVIAYAPVVIGIRVLVVLLMGALVGIPIV